MTRFQESMLDFLRVKANQQASVEEISQHMHVPPFAVNAPLRSLERNGCVENIWLDMRANGLTYKFKCWRLVTG